ncbi:MAG: DMT family transporter, partial [Pseudomonadota bacterium]
IELAAFTYAYSVMPIADAYAISFAAPLIVVALALPLLGERTDLWRAGAVLIGFVGVVIVLRPGDAGMGGFVSMGALAALVGTIAYALLMITARSLGQVETQSAMGFYPTVFVAIASLGLLSFEFLKPTPLDFVLLCTVGLLGGTVTILINQAFRMTPSAVLAPLDYSAMLWALLFGYAIWGDIPTSQMMVGATIIVASGLYLLYRDAVDTRNELSSNAL